VSSVAIGKIITCTVRVSIHGQMGVSIKANILTIKRKATGCTHTPMEEATRVSGKTESSTGKESLLLQKGVNEKGSGLKAREYDGSTMSNPRTNPWSDSQKKIVIKRS